MTENALSDRPTAEFGGVVESTGDRAGSGAPGAAEVDERDATSDDGDADVVAVAVDPVELHGAEVTAGEVDPVQPDADDLHSADSDDPAAQSAAAPSRRAVQHELLVAEGDAAGDYLERLLDILDFDGDIDLDVEGERAVVSIIGDGDVSKLVGERGEVLDALQELTRLAATAETGQRSRLMLDIAGYRAQRRAELTELATSTAQKVKDGGEPVRLPAMNPFERKIVHDAVGTVDGVVSSSEGEEPRRRVVISLAS